jgi:hypothetical protein
MCRDIQVGDGRDWVFISDNNMVFSMLLRNGHQRLSTGTVQDIFMPIEKKSSVTKTGRKNSEHVLRLPALCFSTMQEPG